MFFRKCECLVAHGKWIFRKRISVDCKIKAFDPENIFNQNFTFKSFPKTHKERKRERKDSHVQTHTERERDREPRKPMIVEPKKPKIIEPKKPEIVAPRTHKLRVIPCQSHRWVAPCWSHLNLTRFDDFFSLVLFLLCHGLRNDIIYLFGIWENVRKYEQQVENVFSIVFSRIQPNTKKYFSKYFLKCNQTLENIFFSRK